MSERVQDFRTPEAGTNRTIMLIVYVLLGCSVAMAVGYTVLLIGDWL